MEMLRRIALKGFKSIKAMDLELKPLNVLIGANGAGKSNLISFFKLLNEMTAGRLQLHIGTTGRAQSLLHFGPKVTLQIEARLEFETHGSVKTYGIRLPFAVGDTLSIAEECLTSYPAGEVRLEKQWQSFGAYPESHIDDILEVEVPSYIIIRNLMNSFRVYHFHDTAPTARVRQYCYVGDNKTLLPDAGNLAALLLRLRDENGGTVYRRIVDTVRLIAPFFDDFVLEPTGATRDVMLNWRSQGSDQVFGPHQLSDGTLRAMCLVTLLLQPEDELPGLVIVDEPELGLHPYALNVVAALFKKASHHAQVLVSTQSSAFLDNFEAEDVVVVNRVGQESQFERPDAAKLAAWLDEYSLGEIWEKNVIGGGPH